MLKKLNNKSNMIHVPFFVFLLFVATIPWEEGYVLPGFGTISKLLGLIVIISTGLIIISSKKSLKNEKYLFMIYVFSLWNMATMLWTYDIESSYDSIVTLIQLAVLSWVIIQLLEDDKKIELSLQFYVIGAWAAALGVIFSYLNGIESHYMRFSAAGADPNDLSLSIVVAIPMAWYLFTKSKGMIKILNQLFIPVSIFSVFLTASRGSFLALLVAIIIPFSTIKNFNLKHKTLFAVIILLPSIYLIINTPVASIQRLSTITHEISAGDFSDRITIWESGLKTFFRNPISGVGAGAFASGVSRVHGSEVYPHNTLLSILVNLGSIGFVLFSLMCIHILREVLNLSKDKKTLYLAILLALFIGSMSLGWEHRKVIWLIFALCVAQARVFENENKERICNG